MSIDIKIYDKPSGDFYRAHPRTEFYSTLIDRSDMSNPYFKIAKSKFLVAYKDGRPVGRVVVSVDDLYNEEHAKRGEEPVAWFGWISFEDMDVGEKLMETALETAKNLGNDDTLKYKDLKYLIGPGRPNENGVVGLRTRGSFVYFMEPDHPLWYRCVFDDDWDVENYWIAVRVKHGGDLKRIKNKMKKIIERTNEYGIERVSIRDIGKYLKDIKKVYDEAWSTEEHPDGRKMTDEEFYSMVSGLKLLAPFGWNDVYLARYNDEIVGVNVAIPDFNDYLANSHGALNELYRVLVGKLKSPKRIRVLISGVTDIGNDMVKSFLETGLMAHFLDGKDHYHEIDASQLAVKNTKVILPIIGLWGEINGKDEETSNLLSYIRSHESQKETVDEIVKVLGDDVSVAEVLRHEL